MLKMTIGNEEVVCSNSFTINEEMLSTSSTILKNCYPMSWESDKDYVSRFYYPEDYSKCIISKPKKVLPNEYTEVEYIQTIGTNYINTGISPTNKTGVKIKASLVVNSATDKILFGSRNNNQRFWLDFDGKNGANNISYGFGNANSMQTYEVNKVYDIVFNYNGDKKVKINSTTYDITTSFSAGGSKAIYLGVANYSGGFGGEFRIYHCQIFDEETKLIDLIPCYRNSDNEIGMYDLVSDTFITKSGLGSFLKGSNTLSQYETIFSGIVKNTSDISLNPREPKYCSIQILDNKTLLSEGDTLDFVISNKTILEAIQMVVNAIASYGFELGNVNIANGNEVIGAYSTFNKTAYDVFQYLADISGAKWSTRVVNDNTRAIDFYDPTLMPRAQNIQYTSVWAETNNIMDIKFRYGTYDYRNKQVILSDKVQADINYTETFVADSYTRTFNVSTPINKVNEILVNGVSASVASDKAKEIGVYADFYYEIDSTRIVSNSSNEPYTSGTVIQITYNPLIKGRQMVINENEVARVSNNLNLNGIIARYENRNDVDNSDKLLSIAETYVKFKGQAEVILTITTHDKDLFQIGEITYFEAPINELATDYMVKSKSINIIASGNNTMDVFYTYELSSSFNSERAINWFDNQRNKTMGNIEDGDFISRNIDINNSANVIWDNLQVNEITIDDSYPYENTLESGIETILEG